MAEEPVVQRDGQIAADQEVMFVNRELRTKITERAPIEELHKTARRIGYRPLRYDGLKKALLGLTTIEEVEKATPIEFVS